MDKIIGIDISKQTFDVSFKLEDGFYHGEFTNDNKGFKSFIKLISPDDWVVMEASGVYHLSLASYLFSHGIKVCVENPLVIKRYSQSRLYRAKTDKKDAQTIAEYGIKYKDDLKPWEPESEVGMKIRQLYTRVELLNKQINQTKMQLESFENSSSFDKELKKEINLVLKQLYNSKIKLEKRIESLARSAYGETLDCLQSIPGIGPKTAIALTVVTGGFERFENAKQLTAYIGLSPRIYQSGTSVKGRGHICKMGKPQMRKLLYLCSWTAKFKNKYCRDMYERLSEKGKPERVIKIAIANKLLRQAFAIGKNQTYFNENYC